MNSGTGTDEELEKAIALDAREKRVDEKIIMVYGATATLKDLFAISDAWRALGRARRYDLLLDLYPDLSTQACLFLRKAPLYILANILPIEDGRRLVARVKGA
jgi:hypothetical protein